MTRIQPGLCSVTLRTCSVDDVARAARSCGLRGIEWGGDVHVPPGDAGSASRARQASAAADLEIASYGSYLFAPGASPHDDQLAVLDAAVALGAPNIRVWAGFGIALDSDAGKALADALAAFCATAGERGLTVSLEYHGGTPTETVAGTLALLGRVGAPNLFTYWQPPYWRAPTTPASDAAEVVALGDALSHLHVYEWAGAEDRRPLAVGTSRWEAVLAGVVAPSGRWTNDRYAFVEFVPDDSVEALERDAAVLRGWLAEA